MGKRIRPLSGAERQLWLLSRVSPFQIVLVLELPAGVTAPCEDALRAALDKVRGRHPLPRVRVPQDHMGQFVGNARSMHRVRPDAQLWDLAREVRDQVTARVAESDDLGYNVLNHVLMRVLARWFRPDDKGAARLSRAAAGSMSHTTVLTNMGEVAPSDILEGVNLEGARLHVAMNNLPGSVFVSGAIRLRGRLGWSFAWAEPYLDATTARALADAAVAQLHEALR